MNVYYQNVRGLRTKFNVLQLSVATSSFDVIALTETWLNRDFDTSELGLSNYSVYRRDRCPVATGLGRGGGVLIAADLKLNCRGIDKEVDCEAVSVLLDFGKRQTILTAVYFPPNSGPDIYVTFCSYLDSISELYPNAEVCIIGDFNLPHADWFDETENLGSLCTASPNASKRERESIEQIAQLCSYHNLYQFNTTPNFRGAILDLVISNVEGTTAVRSEDTLVPEDPHHPSLEIHIPSTKIAFSPGLQERGYYYDFKKADYDAINDYLNCIPWDDLFRNRSLDDMINVFYEIIYTAIDSHVPLKKLSTFKFPRWFSPDLRQLVLQKKEAHKKYKNSNDPDDYSTFSRLRAQCKTLSRSCHAGFIREVEGSLCNNIKSFWSFINSKKKDPGLPKVMHLNEISSTNGSDIANLFAANFSSVFSSKSNSEFKASEDINNINLNNFYISISSIYIKLSALDINSGPGPDGVPPSLLRHCSFIIARPLHIIFNQSLEAGVFPSHWKLSHVVPIYKSGNRADIKNYRPISILSCIPKVFECLVKDYMTSQLSGIIGEEQYGFMEGRSAELNLITFVDFLSRALESGSQTDAIYTDFSKAFDRVNHRILLTKLESVGVVGCLLDWLSSYLYDRSFMVRVGNFLSKETPVTSGVPQGSHLGPLLFNIFINDITHNFPPGSGLLFADDLKIFARISSTEDAAILQSQIDSLSEWCAANCMDLNIEKCQIMRFYRSNNPIIFNYSLLGVKLPTVEAVRDLGVTLDSKLTFIPHINKICNKALQMLGFVKRVTSEFANVNSLKILYFSLVRSHLEYCSSVWNPHYAIHIHAIEQVQRKFLRYVAYKLNIPSDQIDYANLESLLNIEPLMLRRTWHDIKLLFNIINFRSHDTQLLGRINFHIPNFNTRNTYPFSLTYHRTNYGFNSPITRIARAACSVNVDLYGVSYSRFLADLRRAPIVI